MIKLFAFAGLVYLGMRILLGKKSNYLEAIATSILISLGFMGFIPFLLNEYFNVDYSSGINYLLIFSVAFFVIVFIFKKSSFVFKIKIPKKISISFPQGILIVLLILLTLRGTLLPLRGWDAISLYDSRARMFLAGLKLSEMQYLSDYDDFNHYYYYSYPPMTSVIHAVFYSQNIEAVMIIYTLFYSTLAIYFYLLLKSLHVDRFLKVGLFLTIILSPELIKQTNIAYTNLPAISFQLAALFYLLKNIKKRGILSIILSSIFLAFSIWTRSLEPIFVGFLLAAIYIILKKYDYSFLKKLILISSYCLIALGTRYIWFNFLKSSVGSIGETTPALSTILARLTDSMLLANIIDVSFFIYIALSPVIYYLIFAFGIFVFILIKAKSRLFRQEAVVVSIILLAMLGLMFLGTMYFSVTFDWWDKIPDSFLRSNLLLVPLLIIYGGLILGESKKNTKL